MLAHTSAWDAGSLLSPSCVSVASQYHFPHIKYLIALLNSHLSAQAFQWWYVAKHVKNGGRKFKRRQKRKQL